MWVKRRQKEEKGDLSKCVEGIRYLKERERKMEGRERLRRTWWWKGLGVEL
jgi:hypothetical protein